MEREAPLTVSGAVLSGAGSLRRAFRRVGLLLIWLTALVAQAEPPYFTLPGRKPNFREPWDVFLGRAAHFVMGRQYQLQHPDNLVFLNNNSLARIVKDGKLGDPARLPESVRRLRPDITDASARQLFELKPDNEESREQARAQAARYLLALNAAVDPDKMISGGSGFEGSLFLDFEKGGALWRLSWRTPESGVTLYRWSYQRKQPGASWTERVAQKEELLPEKEVEHRGEMAEQAIRAAYGKGEWPDDFQGQVYLPVECFGAHVTPVVGHE